MAGILLHDVGKTIEYEGALAARRGRRGILQGHVVLGYQLVRKAALKAKLDPERTERLEHIILSHQGKLEWGAADPGRDARGGLRLDDRQPRRQDGHGRSGRSAMRQAGDEFTERLIALDGPLLCGASRAESAGRPPPTDLAQAGAHREQLVAA